MSHSLESVIDPQLSPGSVMPNPMEIFWEHTQLGIWTLEIQDQGSIFCVVRSNPAAEFISLGSLQSIVGKPWAEIFPAKIAERHQQFYNQAKTNY